MDKIEMLARVLLRPNGMVHIAFSDIRSIYATAANLLELFSDPLDFIQIKSYTYEESTFEINRKRVCLDDVLGLTLASVSSDKRIICDFPELFQFVFTCSPEDKEKKLNMKSFEYETVLSDEKSYLLRYYFEFTNHLTSLLTVKNNIKLRDEIQSEIIREILNTFFVDTLPETSNTLDLTSQIAAAEDTVMYESDAPQKNMVTVEMYSQKHDIAPQTLYKYLREGRIKSAVKTDSKKWLLDINEKPIEWDRRNGRKRKPSATEKHYKRRQSGSAEDVRQHILKRDLFSDKIAQYVHTFEESDYYEKNRYHEVFWNGRPALIVDVNPDYISSAGVSNRELMLSGKPPHFPDRCKDEYPYHLHHIGQNSTSPFAIIPEFDHNKKGLYSVFHPGSPNESLHGPEFEAIKIQFWKTYIEKYDEAGRFDAIEYSNPGRKRNKK